MQETAPHSGDRILDVSSDNFSAGAALARQYQCSIDCGAASFDKVICSFGLHPLNKKLALLKEVKRVLRHGGTLNFADLDQPRQPLEIHMLRGTGYLFDPETAKPNLDGTWLNLIKQAGLSAYSA